MVKLLLRCFTPTTVAISGLQPPITAATTITTTDSAGETVAVAVAAGAGLVGAGLLAAWLFKPVPGGPSAPTTAPPYTTSKQEPPTTTEPATTTSTSASSSTTAAPACPFPSEGAGRPFKGAPDQPIMTIDIPVQTVSSIPPKCTKQGDNGQLFRGTDPGYVKSLASAFCKSDLTKDQGLTMGYKDLPDKDSWVEDKLNGIRVRFDFKFGLQNEGCSKNCIDAYNSMVPSCQYNSHSIYGGASLEQGCGLYSFMVDAEPRTTRTCTGADSRGIFVNYAARDTALQAIDNFCVAQNGKILKQGDEGSFITEAEFSAKYASDCQGSGSYEITTDLCKKYLSDAVDSCDTDTRAYKHGGTVTDTDNCGSFTFHPTSFDSFECYPGNKDKGYITQGTHLTVSPQMAQDAINTFCDRSGDGQTYTLDPAVKPDSGFVQDTCKAAGYASCGYFYDKDGKRVTETQTGYTFIRMSASYLDLGNDFNCRPQAKYDIHGDSCKAMLSKVIGVESQGMCVGSDPNKLDLGSFLESGDKGCVLWNMWAVET